MNTSLKVTESSSPEQLTSQILQKLFGEQSQSFDMVAGTVLGNTDVRVIYLSSDIIHAIYDVLKYETNEAWSLILKNCGFIWGKRVVGSLESELQASLMLKVGNLNVEDYVALLQAYFANHGWGRMQLSLDDAESHGIVRATLYNGLFTETLKQTDTPVEYMIEGMLQGIFTVISEQDLQCTQVSFNHTGLGSTEFLISASSRINHLKQLEIQGLSLNEALEKLRTAR
jgi:predicted hydrocarbon binding protein